MDRKTHIPMMLRGRWTAIISICLKMKNRRKLFNLQRLKVVGLTGFEPATPCTPCRCATRLRYNPIKSDRPGAVSCDGEVYIGKL